MQICIHLVRREPINHAESNLVCSGSSGCDSTAEQEEVEDSRRNLIVNSNNHRAIMQRTGDESSFDRLGAYVPAADKNAFKIAFYNTLLLVFLLLCGVGCWAVYHLLYAFIKPLLWAVLFGTVLFPLKKRITDTIRGWLRGLRDSSTPLVVGVVCLPYKWLDGFAEEMYAIMKTEKVFYIVGGYVSLKLLTYQRTFMLVVHFLANIYNALDYLVSIFESKWLFPVMILYTAGYVGWLYLQSPEPNKKLARVLSLPIWFFILTNTSRFFGPLRVIVFLASSVVIGLIAGGVISYGSEESDKPSSSEPESKEPDESSEPETCDENKSNKGDLILKLMVGGCIMLWTVRNTWMLILLAVPLIFAILKKIIENSGLLSTLKNNVCCDGVCEKVKRMVNVAVPGSLRDFSKFVFSGDQKIIQGLENSMDLLSTIVVMILVLFGAFFLSFFVVFQMHGETVHLFKLTSNVLKSTDRPDWMSMAANFTDQKLTEHDIDVDEYMEQGYQYGRTWLASQVRELADSSDTERADMLEAQVKQLVDSIYSMWESRNIPTKTQAVTTTDMWTHLQHADLSALKNEITLIVKENIGTLMAVAESVWSVLLSNVSLIGSLVGALIGILLSFGLELLNFIIEMIVFLTVLFYLLASSKDQWKPLEVISQLSPSGGDHGDKAITHAIEHAISDVFFLSMRMALFYAMWTWFIHSLFDLNVVFLPSALASMFAAVPLTAPYWVSVIGILELWLVRGELAAALLFFVCSIAPLMFADGAFYTEVKYSHPYVTGLAVVGGIYWLGLEGALIGPMILCGMLVMFNIYTSMSH